MYSLVVFQGTNTVLSYAWAYAVPVIFVTDTLNITC